MKKQLGLSLIETSLVLAISGVAISATLFYYTSTAETRLMDESITQVQSVIRAVNTLFDASPESLPDGTNIPERNKVMVAISELTGLELMDERLEGNKVIRNPLGFGLMIWKTGPRKYQIQTQLNNVSLCSKMASVSLGSVSYAPPEVYAGNTLVKGNITTPAQATEACIKAEEERHAGKGATQVRYSIQF